MSVALAAALTVFLAAATDASAQQIQTFAASSCQASGSTQDLYYSGPVGTTAANRTDATLSAVCPLARRNPVKDWMLIAVFVRDRHAAQDISCTARARDVA
jgi:hypothetical protein